MKETELQELERALQAATPAPWRAVAEAYYLATHYAVRDANDWTIVTDESGDGSDTAAIAALRNAAPSLLAGLREARRLLGEASELLYNFGPVTTGELREQIRAFLGEPQRSREVCGACLAGVLCARHAGKGE